MRQLYPERPIQMIDSSFTLSKKSFGNFFVKALALILPMQSLAWILEVAASSQSNDISTRTRLTAIIFQCFIVGLSLSITANIFGSRASKEYCRELLGKTYPVRFNPVRTRIFGFQFLYQLLFLVITIGSRYLFGLAMTDVNANICASLVLITMVIVWSIFTIRMSFSIPISINETVTRQTLKERKKILNKFCFGSLFGTYFYCWFLAIFFSIPLLIAMRLIIAKGFIKTSVGQLAMVNLIFGFIVAFICVIYTFILVTVYFNGRIKHEGFDIAITIDELEQEGRSRGELLNINAR